MKWLNKKFAIFLRFAGSLGPKFPLLPATPWISKVAQSFRAPTVKLKDTSPIALSAADPGFMNTCLQGDISIFAAFP